MSNYIRHFNNISAGDIDLVGGKGANLGVMSQAGFNVPNGFCITTKAYSVFVKPREKDIYKLLDALDVTDLSAVRKAGQKIRNLLANIVMPEEIIKQIIEAWQELGAQHAYAVRSSATAEDLPEASFAGQQDTYLNVVGQVELLKNIQNCFISLFTDRAIIYRVQHEFDHKDVALSVVVQKMILPKSSGIMFTADPISGHRDIVSIDASFGLGEALVSGLVSADLYQVNKLDFSIIQKKIGDKKIAIMPIKGGGVEKVELADERETQALDDAQLVTLARIGTDIETHYGTPQDIEWAIADGQIYITQSRPITSLFPIPENGTNWPEAEEKVFLSFGHLQMMTDAMPPLASSFIKVLVPFSSMKNGIENTHAFTSAGRIYVDLSNILSHSKLKKIFPKILAKADQLMSKSLIDWVGKTQTSQVSLIKTATLIKLAIPFWSTIIKRLFWDRYENIPQQMSDYADGYLNHIIDDLEGELDNSKKLRQITSHGHQILTEGVIWKTHLAASMLAMFLLGKLVKNYAEKKDLDALMRGLEGNVTTQMDLEVGDLADAARASDALRMHILNENLDVREKLSQCDGHKGGAVFLSSWEQFIKHYGMRCTGEINIYSPRWREDATALMLMVMGILKSGEYGAHRVHYQQLVEKNQLAVAAVLKASRHGMFGFIRQGLARRFIYVLGELFPLREHHKFMIIKFMDTVKLQLLEIAKQLELENELTQAEDIWFLNLPEILDVLAGKAKVDNLLIEQRKQDFKRFQKIDPPRLITSRGEILKAKYDHHEAPKGAMLGSPVSSGEVVGIAKVILDPTQQQLHAGEILVAPYTDPGWTPLFVNAAGLVTEVGGLMTHGSVIAREYGLPAVVGVVDATKHIKTGQRIRVNGDDGYVEILADEENAGVPANEEQRI